MLLTWRSGPDSLVTELVEIAAGDTTQWLRSYFTLNPFAARSVTGRVRSDSLSITFVSGAIRGFRVRSNGDTVRFERVVHGPIFDRRHVLLIVPHLPLALAWKGEFRIYDFDSDRVVRVEARVTHLEVVPVADRNALCYRVEISGPLGIFPMIAYVSVSQPRHLVRWNPAGVRTDLEVEHVPSTAGH
jgi:hypothetical protein